MGVQCLFSVALYFIIYAITICSCDDCITDDCHFKEKRFSPFLGQVIY